MVYHVMYSHYIDGVDIRSPQHNISSRETSCFESGETLPQEMTVTALAEACKREISKYRGGQPYDERYSLELLRRATVQNDNAAWECLQGLFSDIVRRWLHLSPNHEPACRLDSEENYIAQAFERFWQATSQNRHVEFQTTGSALQYLRACLQSVLLDTLRSVSQHREITPLILDTYSEPGEEDNLDSYEIWQTVVKVLRDHREQRLAYLLYHCGLKPREILHLCPGEFSDVREIYVMRRNIIDRLRRNAHRFRGLIA